MKKIFIIILLSCFYLKAFSHSGGDRSFEHKQRRLYEKMKKDLEKFQRSHPNWNTLPNDEYVEFYSDWLKKGHEEELVLHKQFCRLATKYCLGEAEKKAREAQLRYTQSVLSIKNSYAKRTDLNEDSRNKLSEADVKEGHINLCSEHGRLCDEFSSPVDREAVLLKIKRDAREEEIEAAKKALSLDDPDYLKKMEELESQMLKAWVDDHQKLCSQAEGDPLYCSSERKEQKMLKTESNKCFIQRRKQAHDQLEEEAFGKFEQSLISHESDWLALTGTRDCGELLKKDREALGITQEAAPVAATNGPSENEDNRNYDPESCEWVTDMPRKIVAGPGGKECGKDALGKDIKARICTGYVVCNQLQGGGKFIRMSTCSPRNCALDRAKDCTKQKKYHSVKAQEEENESITGEVRKILLQGK